MCMFIEAGQDTLVGPMGFEGMITNPIEVKGSMVGNESTGYIQVELVFDGPKTLKLLRHAVEQTDRAEWDKARVHFSKKRSVACRLALFMDRLYRPDRSFWNFAAVEIWEGLWLPTDERWKPST